MGYENCHPERMRLKPCHLRALTARLKPCPSRTSLPEDVFDFAQQGAALRPVFHPGHAFEFLQ